MTRSSDWKAAISVGIIAMKALGFGNGSATARPEVLA